jgi:hypothetical protein
MQMNIHPSNKALSLSGAVVDPLHSIFDRAKFRYPRRAITLRPPVGRDVLPRDSHRAPDQRNPAHAWPLERPAKLIAPMHRGGADLSFSSLFGARKIEFVLTNDQTNAHHSELGHFLI